MDEQTFALLVQGVNNLKEEVANLTAEVKAQKELIAQMNVQLDIYGKRWHRVMRVGSWAFALVTAACVVIVQEAVSILLGT